MRLLLPLAFVAVGCAHAGSAGSAPGAQTVSSPVTFEAVAAGVWLHRSTSYVEGFGKVSSNGLVVASRRGALIIDTAWTPEQTAQLLDWTQDHVGSVRGVIVTHWHADRAGGLSEVHSRGIPSWGNLRTAKEALAHGHVAPFQKFGDRFDLRALGVEGEAYFPGAGHSLDNVVVWLAKPRLLFGGCLVKAAEARSLGHVADGDTQAWPGAILQLEARYASASIVVPGHGALGGPELLGHTRTLLMRQGTRVGANALR